MNDHLSIDLFCCLLPSFIELLWLLEVSVCWLGRLWKRGRFLFVAIEGGNALGCLRSFEGELHSREQ